MWSPATLGTLASLSHPEARGAVGALALSPADGELLLALEAQSAARLVLWRWRTGECIAHVRAHDDPGRVALFLSPADGTCRIASASDASLKFWAVASGGAGEFTFLQPAEAEAAGAAATTCAVDLGGGGNYGEQSALQNLCGDAGGCVTGAADGALAAYAVLGGKLLRRQPAHHGPVRALCACGGDGRARFVSGGADGRVRLWDGALGPLTSVNLGTAALQHLDRAGRLQMAGGGMRPPAVRSLCWAGGVAVADGDGDSDSGITSSTLLVATAGEVLQFDPTTGAWRVLLQAHEADGVGVAATNAEEDAAGGGAGGPTVVAAHPSATVDELATAGADRTLRLWGARGRVQTAARALPAAPASLAYGGGGAWLAVGDVDGVAHLMRRRELVVVAASRVAAADGAAVTALVFCGDAALVAVGDAAGCITVCAVPSLEPVRQWAAHAAASARSPSRPLRSSSCPPRAAPPTARARSGTRARAPCCAGAARLPPTAAAAAAVAAAGRLMMRGAAAAAAAAATASWRDRRCRRCWAAAWRRRRVGASSARCAARARRWRHFCTPTAASSSSTSAHPPTRA